MLEAAPFCACPCPLPLLALAGLPPGSPMMVCQAEESLALAFLLPPRLPGMAILGREEGGGEEVGGSNRSDSPEADPGEKGESQSRSMSMGEPEEVAETSSWELPLGLCSLEGRVAETLGGRLE